MGTLSTDAFGCGMMCLRNTNCRSYNSKCDGNHGNMTCELSDQSGLSSPDNLLKISGFTYFEKCKLATSKNTGILGINLIKTLPCQCSALVAVADF